MADAYDEMQGSAIDISEMQAHNIPDATDPRWAFTHNMDGVPAMPPVKPKRKSRGKKHG